MSNSHAHLACPLGMFRAEVHFGGRADPPKIWRFFFSFFPCNPLKIHKTTKEKLADSKEMFADSKEILGKKRKSLEAFRRFPRALLRRARDDGERGVIFAGRLAMSGAAFSIAPQ